LMIFDYSLAGFRQLERLFSQFIWGLSEEGRTKRPLIAWDKITQPKLEGGLELHSLREQSQLLKIRNVSKLIKNCEAEWVWMASDIISRSLNTGANRKETRGWSVPEFLLLDPPTKPPSKTL
jgi:hypothetical protein